MDQFHKQLLENNKEWVSEQLGLDSEFFQKLSEKTPPLFWIGCADSRVPANEIIGAVPGEVFVHRNIANMVIHSDMNMLSVLDYAVNVLKVEHIVVCGHYGCGGVKAAMGNQKIGLIDNWIRHIKDVYRFHADELNAIKDEEKRFHHLVELNVYEQVRNLAQTSIIQQAWAKNQVVNIHGWAYAIQNGIIKDLNLTFSDNEMLKNVYDSVF